MTVDTKKRPSRMATGVAVVLLLVFGAGYRLLATHLARSTESAPLAEGTLGRLPMVLGDWQGKDLSLDAAIIEASDADEVLYRTYARGGGIDIAELYIAYGVRGRDLMPHRPEVCYPGNGWVLRDREDVTLPLETDGELECQIYRFAQSGLDARVMTVLNYYVVDGEYCPDVSLLRSKVWRGSGGVNYMAQVQITSAEGPVGGRERARSCVSDLARASAKAIRSLFPGEDSTVSTDPKGPSTTRGKQAPQP